MDIEHARFNMIKQQIQPWNVLSTDVLEALETMKRENFVPQAYKKLAFSDIEIPLGQDPGEVMLSPKVEAKLAQDLKLQTGDRVLEIGTGSGYITALMSLLVREQGHITSYEASPRLAENATENLKTAGVRNVQITAKALTPNTFSEEKTAHIKPNGFDAILLTGSIAFIPEILSTYLKPGGRLLAIVGESPSMYVQRLCLETSGQLSTQRLWDTSAPRLIGFADKPRFVF
jgi:protein-L-isoaspartate(D-aspartate) O-methyltransferase